MTTLLGKAFRNRTGIPFAPRGLLGGGLLGMLRNDATAQLEAMGSIGTLFSIVHRTSNATSQITWHLYRKLTESQQTNAPGLEPQRQIVTRHAALDLWNRPNPFMTGPEFVEAGQQHIDLVGEATIVIYRSPLSPLPLELWPVRPDRMAPVPDPDRFIAGWIYTGPNGERIPLSIDEVIQIKMPNPVDLYRGLGPVQAAMVDIDSARYGAEWNRNFFLNSAEPGGHLEVETNLEPDDFNALRDQWAEQHQGIANAHRVAILEGGVKWKERMFSPKDMQFTQLRNLSSAMMREAFGIHPHMLGITENVNKANADAAEISFARWLVYPRAQRWKAALNTRLLPLYKAQDQVEFDHDRVVPEDREADDRERTSRSQSAATLVQAGYYAPEVLTAMGLPPIAFGSPDADPDRALLIDLVKGAPSLAPMILPMLGFDLPEQPAPADVA